MEKTTPVPQIGDLKPRETAGRDTIARYRAQFRAAAFASLSILSKATDRVYCDFHDDFVCRELKNGLPLYHFYQVKTNGRRNFQWGKLQIFGLRRSKKVDAKALAESFAGKLLFHAVRFKDSCGRVAFLTNVNFDDEVESAIVALQAGDFSHAVLKRVADSFNDALAKDAPLAVFEVQEKISKLTLEPGVQYLNPDTHDFESLAREAIYEYSEIDLGHVESQAIIQNLLALIEKKSCSKLICDLAEDELDELVGVGLSDLLTILSISKRAYDELVAGGDANAIRNASIIQRKLLQAGASEEQVEFCAKWKVAWDMWMRDKRHALPEFDVNFLLHALDAIRGSWMRGEVSFPQLQTRIDTLWATLDAKGLTRTLSRELLFGGVLAALVRSEAR